MPPRPRPRRAPPPPAGRRPPPPPGRRPPPPRGPAGRGRGGLNPAIVGAIGVGVVVVVIALVVMMGKKSGGDERPVGTAGDYSSNVPVTGGPTTPTPKLPPPPPTREELATVERVWDQVRPDVKEMMALFEDGARYIHDDRPKMEELFHEANEIWKRIDLTTRKALAPFEQRYSGEHEELLERYFDRMITERAKWFGEAGKYKKMMGQ